MRLKKVIVINNKGGCGKTTIATNLASYYASRGENTALFDYDPQGSAMRWLRMRSDENASIYGVVAHQSAAKAKAVTMSWHLRLPPETQRLVIDTPPGLKGPDLADQLKGADAILIPVLPSSIDIYATADFIRDLLLGTRVKASGTPMAIIANRTRKNTLALQALERFLNSLSIPVVARLRDSQNYVFASENGLGVHELEKRPNKEECQHWQEIMDWLDARTDPVNS